MLLRALRDFSLGKLTADDTAIFMGLLNDLFPNTVEHVPRAIDMTFEAQVRQVSGPLCTYVGVSQEFVARGWQMATWLRDRQVNSGSLGARWNDRTWLVLLACGGGPFRDAKCALLPKCDMHCLSTGAWCIWASQLHPGCLPDTPLLLPLAQVKEAARELGYQPDETFCLKAIDLGGHWEGQGRVWQGGVQIG